MLICWSDIQSSIDPWQPSRYLLSAEVEKDIGAGKVLERRNPAPELLSGQPMVFQGALAGLRLKKKYRVVTLSFHRDDIDVAAFNCGEPELRQRVSAAVELVFETAFAGVPLEARPPHLVATHTHLGRLEVNIAVPRFVMSPEGKIRSINPHPRQRGSQNLWDALRDVLNTTFTWRAPTRAKPDRVLRGPNWAEKRLAAAERHGVVIDREKDPKLYLLQVAKVRADKAARYQEDEQNETFPELATRLGYSLTRVDSNRLRVTGDREDDSFLIHSSAWSGQASPPASLDQQIKAFGHLWRRRAASNNSNIAKDGWPDASLDTLERLRKPTLVLQTVHPAFSDAKHRGLESRMSFPSRLEQRLRSLAALVGRFVAHQVILDALTMINLAPFGNLSQQLEKFTYGTERKRAIHGSPHGRALRSTPDSFGARRGLSQFRADRRAVVRAWPDQDRNGASRSGAGAGSPTSGHSGRSDGQAEHDDIASRTDGSDAVIVRREYRTDLQYLEAAGVSRGELIQTLVSAFKSAVHRRPKVTLLATSTRVGFVDAWIEAHPNGVFTIAGNEAEAKALSAELAAQFPIVLPKDEIENDPTCEPEI